MEVIREPNLSEFKEHLDDTYPYGLVSGSSVRNEQLGLMILMDLFQPEMFYDPGGSKEETGVLGPYKTEVVFSSPKAVGNSQIFWSCEMLN